MRKCFPNFRKANQKRNWKLKKLDMEEAEPGRKTNQAKEDAEYEQFMMDLEEDEDMRTRVNIYRDKDAKEIDVILEHDGILNPIEIKKTSNPGTELTRVFSLLDKASVPRGKGAVVCMKPKVGVIDRDNYIVPVWTI